MVTSSGTLPGLAIKNLPNKTQKTRLKTHLKAGFLGFYWVFLKLMSILVQVTIFLVKCLWKSFNLGCNKYEI
jgi:hypothetical protein